MPIIKSAKKRVKVAAKANLRNVKTKRSMREALKAYYAALATGSAAEIAKAQKEAVSALDKAAKKDVLHKNKAARKKAQLVAHAKAKGIKPAKAAVKKAPATKPTPKKTSSKTTSKKPSAKSSINKATTKTTAKKPASKK
jgi:small subunit ribosomal protein S20